MRFQICDFNARRLAACGFALLVALGACPPALAQATKWTLTTADFNSRQVELASIDDSGVKVRDGAEAAEQTVAWENLLLIGRESESKPQQGGPAASGGKFVLHLAGGDLIRGEPLKLEGETLQWQSPAVGTMGVPLRQVVALARASSRSAPSAFDGERRTEDVVQLANGDSVRGIVSDISADAVTVQSQGNAVPVPTDSIATVLFASTAAGAATTGPGTAASARAFRVRLGDQSVITAASLKSAGDKLVVTLKGEAAGAAAPVGGAGRELPLASVEAIEQLNGPVSWLSSRTPSESIHTPLLETTRPARMDRSVTGRPIRFGDRTYARGIGVAARSRIVWPLDEATTSQYAAFRTQYAIDSNTAAYADVTVRVKLDDRVVHEKKNVIAGVLSPLVIVPLAKGSKTLCLEVDFGDNYGVQDRLNWIEPALVKTTAIPTAPTSAPRPTTSPSTRSGPDEVLPVAPATTRSTP